MKSALRSQSSRFSLFALAVFYSENLCSVQQMIVAPDRMNGEYQIGDTAYWTIEWKGGTNTLSSNPIRCICP
jgi:hypothetical protein